MSWFGWGDDGDVLHESLVTLAAAHGDDPQDEDWVPEATRKKCVKHLQAHPKFYVKGPDVGSKSTQTQRHHRKLLTGQTNLDNFVQKTAQSSKEKSPDEQVERGSVAEDSGAEVDEDIEGWEEDVSETEDLKKKHSRMCLSEINQLMILRNFGTLCLKGHGRIASSNEIVKHLARHYQIFKQLPIEARGGSKNVRSLLKDETVKIAACTWLAEQHIGSVTPQAFCHALNSTTTLCKGVYMDGHEREDVVKYQNDIFLPAMAKFEKRMIWFEAPELKWVEPTLLPGERILIAEFHDKSCCQQNEFKTSAWVQKGEQILQKKGWGHLIHISDFIEEVNGHLVSLNNDGTVEKSARKVIFPGENGDPYWDCAQLIEQVKLAAIPTFEAAHLGCQALFIFDQPSTHAALPPDTLKAFEMNKSNGGKQRQQKDTIIPDSNHTPEYCGILQIMTTDSGQQKGLEQTLKEHSFNVSGLKAKCSPYWGWIKYRYRQVPKKSFEDAKKAAFEALDSCPVDVIRQFINRAWRFMSKVAAWAVRKQKGHRTVSQAAMMHLDAILS
ncbi:hypothetical protein K439DRAFT_1654601 [Ramaria rubella]|nr:hypothetical protein K439DRAFT_1654601 [Ramaria rubella]